MTTPADRDPVTGASPALPRSRYALDPELDFLNHGSYGAPAITVLHAQAVIRNEMERDPIEFFQHRYVERLDEARRELAAFVGADPAGLVFVRNATAGVNAVLGSIRLEPDDEVLVTDHEYNASRCALDRAAERTGASVRVVEIPLPVESEDTLVERIVGATTERTKLVLFDHVTSPTGIVFPAARIVRELDARGVETLVDAAHAPGMLDLDLRSLGATYYTGNAHKWLGAPRGAGFLVVSESRRDEIEPGVVSHGWNAVEPERSRLHRLFDWNGTDDPSAVLTIPAAIRFGREAIDGGWPAIRAHNRALVLEGRRIVSDALETEPVATESCIGSLASIPLPPSTHPANRSLFAVDPDQRRLAEEHRIVVPFPTWPKPPHRLVRLSAQLYNDRSQYERLAAALRAMFRS